MGLLSKFIDESDISGWLHVSSCIAIFAASITFVWWAFSSERRSDDSRFPVGFWLPVLLTLAIGILSLLDSFVASFSASLASVVLKAVIAVIAWSAVVVLLRAGRKPRFLPPRKEQSEASVMPTLADFPGVTDSFIGKLETALHDAQYARTLLDATIESTASGVVISDLDVNFLVVNPAGSQLLGDICHLPPKDWTSEIGIFHDAKKTVPALEETLPLYRATRGEKIVGMEVLIRNGISKEPIWMRSNASPILDENGVPLGAVAVFEDITELRNNREKLRLLQEETEVELDFTNQRLKQILNSIEEVIWRGEQDEAGFHFVYFSPGVEKLTGLSADQLTPELQKYLDLIHEDDRILIAPTMNGLLNGELNFSEDEYRIRHADGSTRWIRNRLNAVEMEGKRVFQGVMIDITRERDAKMALQRAERLASIGTLAAGIAHEINNPLGAMMLSTERASVMIERGQFSKEQLLETCHNITKQIERCSKIATGVLRFASEGNSPRVNGSLLTSSNEARSVILFKAEKRNISIEVFDDGGDLSVEMDETGICQVIVNLLANAEEASPDNSTIEMQLVSRSDRVELSVHDSGDGVDESTKNQAFDPFFTTRREVGGTGLGLSMCHTIVTKHGGEITIANSTRKCGAMVSFWLPKRPKA